MPTALITGASSGIGAAFARLLAKDKHDLVLVARRADRLDALREEIVAAHGVKVLCVPADLSLPEAPAAIAAKVTEAGLVVDILINNAGLGKHGAFTTASWEIDRSMIDLNITALTAMTRQFLPGMVERKTGGVINVASTASFQPIPYMGVYAATKAYVLSLSEALAEEMAPHGVKIVCLCPGPTESEFTAVAEFKTDITEKAPMMSAEAVAAEGISAFRAGRVIQIPGMMNALTALSPRFLPRSMVAKVTGMIFKPNR
ncbi:MAG: short-chain dehydrogenase [Cyanobacteria bacterium RYN_339]|nr:short-chain dehydrogenase [Cyanobacteria bacterium RYN_339]